uniref:Uncharacterized protein n=1 Tax=Esox lucius TaxID=8010 RepID=A0A3P8Y5E4_ESOLU
MMLHLEFNVKCRHYTCIFLRNIATILHIAPLRTKMMSLSRCMISLCTLNNLGHSMQFGDEKAGEATKDPHGIGKR